MAVGLADILPPTGRIRRTDPPRDLPGDILSHAANFDRGMWLCRRSDGHFFHSNGWDVEGWVHSDESAARLSVKPYSIRVIDVSQRCDIAKRAGAFDAVIHCASSGGGDAEAYREIYLNGGRHLLETFPKARVLFTSSTSVYAQRDGSRVTEESEKNHSGNQPDPFRSGKLNPRKRWNHSAARRDLRAATFGAVDQIPKRHGDHWSRQGPVC